MPAGRPPLHPSNAARCAAYRERTNLSKRVDILNALTMLHAPLPAADAPWPDVRTHAKRVIRYMSGVEGLDHVAIRSLDVLRKAVDKRYGRTSNEAHNATNPTV